MADEFLNKPSKIQPAIAGNIADPDEYNANITGQSKDSVLGINKDGNYEDFDIGDENNDSLGKEINLRESSGGLVNFYDGSNVLQKTTNLSQATESQAGPSEIATQTEVDAGVDDEKIVTPLKLANFGGLSGGNLIGISVFTSSGTWNKPAQCNSVLVKVIGGGGSGSSNTNDSVAGGGGGGAGGYSEKFITSGLSSSETVTIGAGGLGVSGNNVGNPGGTSSFGAHCSATGGIATANSRFGGDGGIGSGGDINTKGNGGGTGSEDSGNVGGTGGNSVLGGGGFGAQSNASNGNTGGGGGGTHQGTSGAGGSGIVVVYEYT